MSKNVFFDDEEEGGEDLFKDEIIMLDDDDGVNNENNITASSSAGTIENNSQTVAGSCKEDSQSAGFGDLFDELTPPPCSQLESQFDLPVTDSFAVPSILGKRSRSNSQEHLESPSKRICEEKQDSNAGSFFLFTKASGKAVQPSATALKKAQKLIQTDATDGNTTFNADLKIPAPTFSLFATASGKAVLPSANALREAQQLMEIDTVDEPSPDINKDQQLLLSDQAVEHRTDPIDSAPVFSLFTKASGKAVQPSASALKKAQQLMEKDTTDHSNEPKSDPTPAFSLFTKASGKAVQPSASALKKAQKLMETDIMDENAESKPDSPNTTPVFSLFSKASGKAVQPSASALKKAQQLMETDTMDETPEPKAVPLFSRASGKAVVTSETALEKAKAMMQDSQTSDSPSQSSFQTPAKLPKSLVSSRYRKTPQAKQLPPTPERSSTSESNTTNSLPSFVTPNKVVRRKFRTPYAKIPSPKTPDTPFQQSSSQGGARPPLGGASSAKSIQKITAPVWLQVKPLGKGNKIQLGELFKIPSVSLSRIRNLGVNESAIQMNSRSATSFRFDITFNMTQDFLNLISEASQNPAVKNQSEMVQDANNSANSFGFQTFRMLLIHLGAAENVVTESWVENHYRWIVWKLACYERRFPQKFALKCLTPERVLSQLIHRYDREYCNGKRSAIKLITERDDLASRYLVLCVASVHPSKKSFGGLPDNSENMIELTDGWYSILAQLDEPLNRLKEWDKIREGQKLRMCGITLSGPDTGVPPLEVTAANFLALKMNAVRKAKQNEYLGFHSKKHFKINVKSIHKEGGSIPSIEAVVMRRYPILYMQKRKDNPSIIRSERAEMDSAANSEDRIANKREKLAQDIQQEMEDEAKQTTSKRKSMSWAQIKTLTDGRALYKALQSSSDPYGDISALSRQQQEAYERYMMQKAELDSRELQDRLASEMRDDEDLNRMVSSFIDVKLKDCCPYANKIVADSQIECSLRVWGATPDTLDAFEEGNRIRVYGLQVNKYSLQQTVGISLNTTRQTVWEVKQMASKMSLEDKEKFGIVPRKPMLISEMSDVPLNSEIDITGVILHVSEPKQHISKNNFNYSVREIFVTDLTSESIILIRLRETDTRILDWGFLCPSRCYSFFNITLQEYDQENGMFIMTANEASDVMEKPSLSAFRTATENVMTSMREKKDKFNILLDYVVLQM